MLNVGFQSAEERRRDHWHSEQLAEAQVADPSRRLKNVSLSNKEVS